MKYNFKKVFNIGAYMALCAAMVAGLPVNVLSNDSYVLGDLNGDRNVDVKDVAMMKRYLAGWDVEFVSYGLDTGSQDTTDEDNALSNDSYVLGDLNGDRNVNERDVDMIKRYLAGWDVEFVSYGLDTGSQDATGEELETSLIPYEQLYADILKNKDGGGFKLIYIDDNDIPELAYIAGDGAHLDQVSLYVIEENAVVYLGDFGAYGTLSYSEKNNRIFAYSGVEENEELEAKFTYMIEKGEIKTAPDNKGYTKSRVSIDNTFENNDSNIELMLNGELK